MFVVELMMYSYSYRNHSLDCEPLFSLLASSFGRVLTPKLNSREAFSRIPEVFQPLSLLRWIDNTFPASCNVFQAPESLKTSQNQPITFCNRQARRRLSKLFAFDQLPLSAFISTCHDSPDHHSVVKQSATTRSRLFATPTISSKTTRRTIRRSRKDGGVQGSRICEAGAEECWSEICENSNDGGCLSKLSFDAE